jgi:hypothetical protein
MGHAEETPMTETGWIQVEPGDDKTIERLASAWRDLEAQTGELRSEIARLREHHLRCTGREAPTKTTEED